MLQRSAYRVLEGHLSSHMPNNTAKKIAMITVERIYPGCHEAAPRRAVHGEHYELLTLSTGALRSSTLRFCGSAGLSQQEEVEAKIWLKSGLKSGDRSMGHGT